MEDRIEKAVYAGTFDPITNGHVDIIKRALRVFPKLVIAVGTGDKKKVLFSINERKALIAEALSEFSDRIEIEAIDGLLVDFVKDLGVSVIIRGLRTVADYDYEAQMALVNRQLEPEIETVFLVTSQNNSFISSSIVKEVARKGGDVGGLVPACVKDSLKKVS